MDTVSTKALESDIEYPLRSNALSAKSVLGGRVALITIEGTERTPQTLDSLVHQLGQRIRPMRIIARDTGVLDVVAALEPHDALRPSIVDILRIGDKLRRRSIGSRHFEWRTG